MAVAKDVIAQLKANIYKATPGKYVEIHHGDAKKIYGYQLRDRASEVELCKVIPKFEECHVCALGSAFLSAVKLGDQCKISEAFHYGGSAFQTVKAAKVIERGAEVFGRINSALIEAAFERYDQGARLSHAIGDWSNGSIFLTAMDAEIVKAYTLQKNNLNNAGYLLNQAYAFHDAYAAKTSSRVLLTKIMENVARNNGAFIPTKLVVA